MTGQSSSALKQDSGLLCLVLLARYHGVPADVTQLRHQFGGSGSCLSDVGLLRAAKYLGFKAARLRVKYKELAKVPLPAMTKRGDGRHIIVAKVEPDKCLVQDPTEDRPKIMTMSELERTWCGEILLITKQASVESNDLPFNFTWFIPAIVKYRHLLGEVLIASLFLQIFALLTPLFTQVVIDKVLVHKGFTTLHVLAVGMAALVLFDAILGGLRTYQFAHTTNRIDVVLGAQLFRHVLSLPLTYFEARRVGDTVARVRELEHIRQFLTSNAVTVVLDILFTAVFLVVMWFYSHTLTLIVLGSMPFYAALSLIITPIIRSRLNEKFDRGAENQSFLVEAITGIQTIKALAVEPPLQRRWEAELAGYVLASFRATSLITAASQVAALIQKLTTIAILWTGAYLVIGEELSIGQLIAFNMLAGQVTGPLLRLVNLWQEFQQVGISVQRLGDILNTRPESIPISRTALPQIAGRISFEGITFRYRPDGPTVLRNMTFTVSPGQVIGLVGRSGSGKSTIGKLLQRLYVPEHGKVLIDGIDLAQVDPAWLRRQVSVVLQDNFLFNGSVRENIALTDPGLPMERVIQAAQLAGAHEFILELPEGYDTRVGEHGCSLSGGQRQRIAIARALITNPRVLIFDEATSALDYESEAVIQRNMSLIAQGRTVIVIAHRLSTVRSAHRILAIDKGDLIEDGTHEELVKKNGLYTGLYRHQEGRSAAA